MPAAKAGNAAKPEGTVKTHGAPTRTLVKSNAENMPDSARSQALSWIVEPFSVESNWLEKLPAALDEEAADLQCGVLVQRYLRAELQERSVRAQLAREELSPAEIEELLKRELFFLVKGKVSSLTVAGSEGQAQGVLEASFLLKKAKGERDRSLVTVLAGKVKRETVLQGEVPDRKELEALCRDVAKEIAERVTGEAVSSLMASRG